LSALNPLSAWGLDPLSAWGPLDYVMGQSGGSLWFVHLKVEKKHIVICFWTKPYAFSCGPR